MGLMIMHGTGYSGPTVDILSVWVSLSVLLSVSVNDPLGFFLHYATVISKAI